MKLHIKLSLAILSGLVVIVIIAQVAQYVGAVRLISNLSENTIAILKEGQEQAIRNILRSVERAVSDSMERGDMEEFSRLLEAQNEVEGLLEFSLYNSEGVITHSSDSSLPQQKHLPEDLRNSLLINSDQLYRKSSNAIVSTVTETGRLEVFVVSLV